MRKSRRPNEAQGGLTMLVTLLSILIVAAIGAFVSDHVLPKHGKAELILSRVFGVKLQCLEAHCDTPVHNEDAFCVAHNKRTPRGKTTTVFGRRIYGEDTDDLAWIAASILAGEKWDDMRLRERFAVQQQVYSVLTERFIAAKYAV